jgi:hypothetical protein
MKGKLLTGITPSKLLDWTEDRRPLPVFPPATAEINGDHHFISGFTEADTYYAVEVADLAEALCLSVAIHGKISIVELSNISCICTNLHINHEAIEVFRQYNIKGRQNFQTLEAVASYPSPLKKYLSARDIPLKTLAVFNKLNDICKTYIIETLTKKDLSVGDFRNLVNVLFDMMPKITHEDLTGDVLKNLSAQKDAARLGFLSKLKELTGDLPMAVTSADNFETGKLTFSFTAESAEEFFETITSAESKMSQLQKIYGFLDEQNIS